MLVHLLPAQNGVRTVVKCIPLDVLCARISDANTNEKIPWKESVTGRSIIRLKGPGATLDIQQRYDGASDKMIPVDDATLQLLRKNLPLGKLFRTKQW